jgi:hypothetical protein
MPYAGMTPDQTYALRKDIVTGYNTLIEEIIEREDAERYYVNFLFNGLPGRMNRPKSIL